MITKFVRVKGIEPPRLTALDPKSSASTNFATPAVLGWSKIRTTLETYPKKKNNETYNSQKSNFQSGNIDLALSQTNKKWHSLTIIVNKFLSKCKKRDVVFSCNL